MADINIGELATVVLRKRSEKLADNITNHNALWRRLNEKGNVRTATGGRTIIEEVEYAENSTVKWFSGYEVLDTTPVDIVDAAEFNWKQLGGTISMNGLERVQNSGEMAIFNWLDVRVRNLEKSMKNTGATAVYADGTGTSGKEIGGLQLIVADTNTNTVGGINANTYSFWQNTVSASAATSSGNVQSRMNTLWLSLVRGADKPDLIVADSDLYTDYWESLQTIQRVTSSDSAAAGFTSLTYMNAPFVYDDQCPTKRMYFLNTDYIFLRPSSDNQFEVGERRYSINQDAFVIPITWVGNMTCSNRALQGVMIKA